MLIYTNPKHEVLFINLLINKNNFMLHSFYHSSQLECGTDEAGRGCLAGPVTAAAIILPEDFELNLLNDSKLTTEKVREKLKSFIEESAICFAVTHLGPKIIDKINILNASIKAMQESIVKLNPTPIYIIVDGNSSISSTSNTLNTTTVKRFSEKNNNQFNSIPFTCIIKGDSKYKSIAAASILAKTYRDEYMNTIHEEFPMYNWKKNKGYPTKEHRDAIREYGTTKYHRMSFRLLPEQLKLDL
jgi:ribonuclease HII